MPIFQVDVRLQFEVDTEQEARRMVNEHVSFESLIKILDVEEID